MGVMRPAHFTPEKECYTVLILHFFRNAPPATNRESPEGKREGNEGSASSALFL
jgi:hypothetical protein